MKKEKRDAEVEQTRYKTIRNRIEKLRKKIRKVRMKEKVEAVLACR